MSQTPPKSGRMGTFDNRYRYDHIYPRGRSGETLRAWDTQESDRPVVIKRPAPQDAPPMRSAQEVSIRTERKALERLAGHPVLTELRGTGTFRVGGMTHEYIAMDRAEGEIVAEMVMELAERGERLPTLEMLVIVDNLLDLLALAHDQQIVYNDVDAKHLFWDRDTYSLKVIDWGNAVLLDEGGTHNITRQTDVYQVGELLYFIITGGKRLDSETSPDGDYAVTFGVEAAHTPAALQPVITQATHPNLRKRYTTILVLRQRLRDIRKPLEEKRDGLLNDIRRALATPKNHQELAYLTEQINEAMALDPGYPESHRLQTEIEAQLHRLEVQSNIDAGRIYLDTANWPRAIETMLDLLNDADEQTAPVIRFIVAAAEMLDTRERSEPPAALAQAIDELLNENPQQAGIILVTTTDDDDNIWLAERLAALVPSVVLLRPHLMRLQAESDIADETMAAIEALLNHQPDIHNLTDLLNTYHEIKAQLDALRPRLVERLPDIVDRAIYAADRIIELLQSVGQTVYGSPARAGDLLRLAHQIDPQNDYFDHLNDYFEEIHLAVKALSSFKPQPDGANLRDWFTRVLNLLEPYGNDIEDPKLHQTLDTLRNAARLWEETLNAFIIGGRIRARTTLNRIAQLMQPLNHHITEWAKAMGQNTEDVAHVEILYPNDTLAKSLADGYDLWDKGQYRQAARLADRIAHSAETDGEKLAVERLSKLSSIPADWLENKGPTDYEYTDQTEQAIVALFLPDENTERERFAEQMPTENAYLKTMGRGLVESIGQRSTAGVRILFLHYVWRGMLCVQQDDLIGAEFWREAALRTLDDAASNPIFAEMDTHLNGRRLILEAQTALNRIQSPEDLAEVRTLLNQPLADQWLPEAQRAVRHLEVGVRNWEDGDFRSAHDAFDTAMSQLQVCQQKTHMDLNDLIAWVKPLRDNVTALQTSRLKLEEIAHSTSVPPPGELVEVNPVVGEVLNNVVEITRQSLGDDHAHQVQQWLATYRAVLETYTRDDIDRTEKLVEFQTHFAGLFINKHPTYRLFQVWRDAVQNLPSQPPPETATAEETTLPEAQPGFVDGGYDDRDGDETTYYDDDPDVQYADAQASNIPWGTLIAIGVVIVGVLAFALLGGFGEDDDGNNNVVTTDESPTPITPTLIGGRPTHIPPPPSSTPTRIIATNTETAPLLVATQTDVVPTDTATPTATPTITATTPSPTNTTAPTTAAPSPTEGDFTFDSFPQDVLRALNGLPRTDYDWNPAYFQPAAGDPWQLGATKATVGEGERVVVEMSPQFLAALYGGDAAERIIAIEAEMQLTQYDDEDVESDQSVYFGLGLEADTGHRTSAEIHVTNSTGTIGWGLNENGVYRQRSTLPPAAINVTIRIERNPDGTLTLFIDNQRLGQSEDARYGIGVPLSPVLYTSGGGVIVVVFRLQYEFSPIQ